jgi:hypothetical protein
MANKAVFFLLAFILSGFAGYYAGCEITYQLAFRTGRAVGIGMGSYYRHEAIPREMSRIEYTLEEDIKFINQHGKNSDTEFEKEIPKLSSIYVPNNMESWNYEWRNRSEQRQESNIIKVTPKKHRDPVSLGDTSEEFAKRLEKFEEQRHEPSSQ